MRTSTLGFVPGPRTPLAGVSKLMPGHALVVDAGGVRVERYWSYPQPGPDRPEPRGRRAEACSSARGLRAARA